MNFQKSIVRLLFMACAWNPLFSQAQIPTFHEDIAPIIYENCTFCHREGEIGPMPLTTYAEISDNGSFIEYVTQSGYMPPWTPDHEYSSLLGQRVLTTAQIDMISAWVAGGMLEGNPDNNPGLPIFPPGSQIGVPDLVLSMPEPYTHGGDFTDQYQVFIIPTGVTETKDVRAVEIRPGNTNIAHHALIGYTNLPGIMAQAAALDVADPAPGYESFGDYTVEVEDFLFGGWVPGTPALTFPPSIGKVIEPGSQLLLQMHYGPNLVEQSDLTEINIFYADEPIQREIETLLLDPFSFPEPFILPANQISSFHGTTYVSSDVSVLSVMPHSHLLGKSWLVFATSPDNQDTIPMISIPDWDFHWQGVFTFPHLLHIPGGYTVHAIAEYDNTSDNPENPNNPPLDVSWGDYTTDEMFVLFFQYVSYLTGDENISISGIDENTQFIYTEDKLFPVWPNPAVSGGDITIGFSLTETGTEVSLELFDLNGRKISSWVEGESFPKGRHLISKNLGDLPSGSYVYRLTTSSGAVSSKILQVISTD